MANYTSTHSRGTHSYDFAALSADGHWRLDEIPVVPATTFTQVVSFDWHDTGFGLFWTQYENDEPRTGYLEIRCQR